MTKTIWWCEPIAVAGGIRLCAARGGFKADWAFRVEGLDALALRVVFAAAAGCLESELDLFAGQCTFEEHRINSLQSIMAPVARDRYGSQK